MDLYRDLIIDLYKNPLNKGPMADATLTHSGANVMCGDRLRIYAKINPSPIIAAVSFEGEGCAISIAAASLLTENARGKSIDEVTQWNALTIFDWLETELGPARIKCGLLALETLQEAIKNGVTLQASKISSDSQQKFSVGSL